MKALELLKSQEQVLLEDSIESKKVQALASTFNALMAEMNNQIKSFEEFASSQLHGAYNDKLIVAKSLARFFEGNKHLKVDMAVMALENEEKTKLNEYYSVKTRLLDTIRALITSSNKEAVVSNYDIYEGQFVKCEAGHEIIILNGRNTGVLETLLSELDAELIVNGNFGQIEAQAVDYNLDTLNRNIELCERKNNEIYGSKTGKLNKITTIIERLQEVGNKIVAFYSYKESLELIGCNPKGIRDYENELSKSYIPLKKTLQKELRIELEDICNVVVNEDEYQEVNIEEPSNLDFSSPLADSTLVSDENFDNSAYTERQEPSIETPSFEEPVSNGNSFENTSPFDNVENTISDPFENTSSNPSPFDNVDNSEVSPFESAPTSNPFEGVSSSSPFENAENTNPFDITSNTSPFENASSPSPFESVSNDVFGTPTEERKNNPFDDLN